jgi:hypothetical protein
MPAGAAEACTPNKRTTTNKENAHLAELLFCCCIAALVQHVALDLLHEGCLAVLLCVEHCHDSNGVVIFTSTHYGADLGLRGSTAQHSKHSGIN